MVPKFFKQIISWLWKVPLALVLPPEALELRTPGNSAWPFMISGFSRRVTYRMPKHRLRRLESDTFVWIEWWLPWKEIFLLVLLISLFGFDLFLFFRLGCLSVGLDWLFLGCRLFLFGRLCVFLLFGRLFLRLLLLVGFLFIDWFWLAILVDLFFVFGRLFLSHQN